MKCSCDDEAKTKLVKSVHVMDREIDREIEHGVLLESACLLFGVPLLEFLWLTRGGNGIGVFVNTYQDGFCVQGLTDFPETFQDTSDNIT